MLSVPNLSERPLPAPRSADAPAELERTEAYAAGALAPGDPAGL